MLVKDKDNNELNYEFRVIEVDKTFDSLQEAIDECFPLKDRNNNERYIGISGLWERDIIAIPYTSYIQLKNGIDDKIYTIEFKRIL